MQKSSYFKESFHGLIQFPSKGCRKAGSEVEVTHTCFRERDFPPPQNSVSLGMLFGRKFAKLSSLLVAVGLGARAEEISLS